MRHSTRSSVTLSLVLVACALLVIALCPAPARAQSDLIPQSMLAGQEEALQQARQLSHTMLPAAPELGPDWKYPWQLPAGITAAAASEDAYWQGAGKQMRFVALSQKQASDLINSAIPQMAAQSGMSARDAKAMLLAMSHRVRPIDRLSMTFDIGRKGMAMMQQQMAAKEDNDGGRQDGQAMMRQLMAPLIQPYASLDDAALSTAFIGEMTRIKKTTMMSFYRSNDWGKIAKAKSDKDAQGVWLGKATIQLAILDPARSKELADVTEQDAQNAQQKMSADLAAMIGPLKQMAARVDQQQIKQMDDYLAQLDQQIASAQDAQMRSQMIQQRAMMAEKTQEMRALAAYAQGAYGQTRVVVKKRDYGASSYVIRLHGVAPDTPGMDVGLYTGFVRNGNAIAQVELSGNFPEAEMDKEMDHFLSELDARTRAQADDL